MCKKIGEFMNHLLLHYDMTLALRSTIFSHFGMSWVNHRRVIDLLLGGGPLEGQGVMRCGKWRLFSSFGVYRKK
jgi:hypothetical protein